MRFVSTAIAACAIGAPAAMAGGPIEFLFEVTNPPGSAAGGAIDTINSSFRPSDNRFEWTVRFSDQISDGYTLVLSPGDMPQGTAGEFAAIYFDATDTNNPVVSIYGYNGLNNPSSFRDGSEAPGNQTPDRILSTLVDPSFIVDLSVADDGLGGRTMTLIMDATVVNTHSPAYPGPPGTDWTGLAYGEEIGVWFHPFSSLTTEYHPEGGQFPAATNYLSRWIGVSGFYDAAGLTTTLVPAPGTAALIAMSGLIATRRRR